MTYISPNGVAYDVGDSPYSCYRNGLQFKFSSARHLEKFMTEVRIREEWLTDSMSRRFKVRVECAILADIQLYMQIEKRGFYIYDEKNGVEYTCLQQLELDGLTLKWIDSNIE